VGVKWRVLGTLQSVIPLQYTHTPTRTNTQPHTHTHTHKHTTTHTHTHTTTHTHTYTHKHTTTHTHTHTRIHTQPHTHAYTQIRIRIGRHKYNQTPTNRQAHCTECMCITAIERKCRKRLSLKVSTPTRSINVCCQGLGIPLDHSISFLQ